MVSLTLSSATKVAEVPGRANAFSLPAGDACPHATPTCKAGCYAKKGRFHFASVTSAYARNFDAIREAGTVDGMARLLLDALKRTTFQNFRIHVSGDFFSPAYAEAWNIVCAAFPSRLFWAYTRSQDDASLAALAAIPNLRAFLSCDRDNWKTMLGKAAAFPGFRLCYYSLGEKPDFSLYACDGDLVVFLDQSVRGKMAFPGNCVAELGEKSGIRVDGACLRCKRCMSEKTTHMLETA